MKARAILWAALLIASHAALYFLAGPRAARSNTAEAAVTAPGVARSAKARDRGPRQEQSSPSALLGELLAADLPEADFKAAREALLIDWIRRDLRGALDLFYRPGSPAVYRKLADDSRIEEALAREIARQPEAVWEWIRAGRYGSNRVEVTQCWNTALIATGQRELVLANAAAGGPTERADALEKLCERAMPDELVKIRALLDEGLQRRDSWGNLVDAYALRLVNAQDGKEAAIFASEENPEIRSELCQHWVERELKDLPAAEVAARLGGVPADLLDEMLQTLASEAPHGKIAGTVALLEELGQQGIWNKVDAGTAQLVASNLVMQTYKGYMETEDVFSQLGSISDPAQRSSALERLGAELSDSGGRAETLQKIAALPAGAERSHLLEGFVQGMDEAAAEWDTALSLIGDPDLREALEKQRAQDPGKARRELIRQVDEAWEVAVPEIAPQVESPARSLYRAEGFYNLGKYSDAITQYEEVLKADPYNAAALRGIEAARRDAEAVRQQAPVR